ncbi:MAG: arginine deiminase family protein [Firmicutes bacterium]|nr:arginine deiminase family protein [Bacillota bacterium]
MEPIQLSVFSEIDRLKQVVIHHPGPEVDLMVPAIMEKLLFDDILHGEQAREEHALFRAALGRVAEEVLDIQDLFVEALAKEGTKLAFIEDLRRLVNLSDATCNLLREMSSEACARSVISGIQWDDIPNHTHWQRGFEYRLRPIPNLLFMRDPAAVLGTAYSINSMATWAREREPLILSYVFRHHPRLKHLPKRARLFDQVTPLLKNEIRAPLAMEGGDMLVMNHKVLAIGCSERTSADAVHHLAESLRDHYRRGETGFEHLLMVLMPPIRSAMHLDTVFTRTSEDECLIYPPFFGSRSRELLNVMSIDLRNDELRFTTQPSLLKTLRQVGIDLKPIACGGNDYVKQQREQWTDGANAFAMAPGVIFSYSRNIATASELDRHGYRVLPVKQLLADPFIDLLDGRKYVIQLECGELSRARGGPRCMTMPLSRVS